MTWSDDERIAWAARYADRRIFVSLVSFCDPEVARTVDRAFAAAAEPARIRFGICHQFDEATADALTEFAEDPRVAVDRIPREASEGAGWARSRADDFFDAERYVLRLSGSVRFADGWDRRLIDVLESASTSRPVVAGPGYVFARGRFVIDVPADPQFTAPDDGLALAVRAYTHGYDLFSSDDAVIVPEGVPAGRAEPGPEGEGGARHITERLLYGDDDGMGRYGLGRLRTVAGFARFREIGRASAPADGDRSASCRFDGVLGASLTRSLAEWAGGAAQRIGPEPSWYVGALDSAAADPLRLDGDLRRWLTDAIEALVPSACSRLGVTEPNAVMVELVLVVDDDAGAVHGPVRAMPDESQRRLLDVVVGLGDAPGTDSVEFAPSDAHHLVARPGPATVGEAQVWLQGFVTTAPAVGAAKVSDHVALVTNLQCTHLPKLSASGFEIGPLPPVVHDLLRSMIDLRGGRRRGEDADRRFHLGGDNDFIDVTDLTAEILGALQPLHERFSGVELEPTALYGLRGYREGAVLAMHVDRIETHIVSSVIQVAQDVDEPWPLQLELDGRIHEVVLAPGQMLFYEGASTMHGRVTPLRGRSFVNVFAHYRPVGWEWTEALLLERAGYGPADHGAGVRPARAAGSIS